MTLFGVLSVEQQHGFGNNMLTPLGGLSGTEDTCEDCIRFQSLDNKIATVSYGFCKYLKIAVRKDDKEACSAFKRKEK